jgi:hypothetical protein
MRILCVILAIALVSCENKTSNQWTTLSLVQDKPVIVNINLNEKDTTKDAGDEFAFEAKLRDTANNEVGTVLGMLVTVTLPHNAGVDSNNQEEKLSEIAYHFSDTDGLVVEGINGYAVNSPVMPINVPQLRAIVGGTGKYKGARGQVTLVHKEDGKYYHTLEYKLD